MRPTLFSAENTRSTPYLEATLLRPCESQWIYGIFDTLFLPCGTFTEVTELLWNSVRPTLPTRKKKRLPERPVVVMDDVHIPEEHKRVLQLGPKFCLEPHLRAIDKVALARSVSNKVKEEDKSRCITECVELLPRSEGRKKRIVSLDPAIDFFTNNGLRVLLSDKEGSFVVMPEGMFSEKAGAAVCKNFREVSEKPQEVVKKVRELLLRLHLEKVCSEVKKMKGSTMETFFSVKTHKPDFPFRAIVSERGTWCLAVSTYLQSQLSSLKVEDPFIIPNSSTVVDFLKGNVHENTSGFSIDIEDLYYSLPHDELMTSVKECIGNNDEMEFVSKCGISVPSFLELLFFYIKHTYVGWKGKNFVQRSGICIGSKVAPVLSNIFLARVDNDLVTGLDGLVQKVYRYVDDYLLLINSDNFDSRVDEVLRVFGNKGRGLTFTREVPKNGKLRFLDLQLSFQQKHVCWMFSPWTAKPLLDYSSGHSRLVKKWHCHDVPKNGVGQIMPTSYGDKFFRAGGNTKRRGVS
ncbi:hypothetical protein HPB51_029816 [Rhipicephalus microplus]|uniref:Reverse transcriptase domain-containing protein n=1 Tax=Rhipicephalus microplus TaxID=6941 RepID=A0A9J6CTC9_RHIMP|nr:hypothetical protein HPB51_029816 [Rhipicephalus microplus]